MVDKINPTYLGNERLENPQKGELIALQDRRGYIQGVSYQFVSEDSFLVFKFQGFFPCVENDLIFAEDVIRLDSKQSTYAKLPIYQDRVSIVSGKSEPIDWSVRHVFQGEEQIAKAIQAEREFAEYLDVNLRKKFGSVEEKIRFLEECEVRIDC